MNSIATEKIVAPRVNKGGRMSRPESPQSISAWDAGEKSKTLRPLLDGSAASLRFDRFPKPAMWSESMKKKKLVAVLSDIPEASLEEESEEQ
mmetsp:Transcript_16456/g.44180  ORF Transcript_16456/g.44180 Transcript_16456/m.44180 type:complete len:92 (-) Transcript_16456:90-365(-)